VFDGVQNFPTVGLIDGNFRPTSKRPAMGYDKEIRGDQAGHDIDMFTLALRLQRGRREGDGEGRRRPAGGHVGLTTAGDHRCRRRPDASTRQSTRSWRSRRPVPPPTRSARISS